MQKLCAELEDTARLLRQDILTMIHLAGDGHPGPSMSVRSVAEPRGSAGHGSWAETGVAATRATAMPVSQTNDRPYVRGNARPSMEIAGEHRVVDGAKR